MITPGALVLPDFDVLWVGWLSGQKQRSVKPSGYALHRFESYSYHHLTTREGGFFRLFIG